VSTPRDRTKDEYGSAVVLGRDAEQPRRWRIRWGCCGREQVVNTERCGSLSRTLPTRCAKCVLENRDESPRAVADRERKEALKLQENNPDERRPTVIQTPGGWWPELGRMGPRYG
jgi:hypothetical protein